LPRHRWDLPLVGEEGDDGMAVEELAERLRGLLCSRMQSREVEWSFGVGSLVLSPLGLTLSLIYNEMGQVQGDLRF
jgi:hypothetical protein